MRLNRPWFGTAALRARVVGAIALLTLIAGLMLIPGAKLSLSNLPAKSKPAATHPVVASFAHLPLIFEPNQGQTDSQVKFVARGPRYALFLTRKSAVLKLRTSASANSVLTMDVVNANPDAEIAGADLLPGKSNYFIGNDPSQWRRNVPQFSRVRYRNIYRGVDLVYYGNQGEMEYDFQVAPQTDPGQLALKFHTADKLSITDAGDLIVPVSGGNAQLHAPRIYQLVDGRQQKVSGRFAIRTNDTVGFELGNYDRSRTLVIDPILTYSTFLGGSGDEACSIILGTGTPLSGCPAVAVDSGSNAYIAGSTTSVDFPTVAPFQTTKKGTANIFVAKFNSAANTLLFSTYLGGSGTDYTAGVAIDQGFDVVVAGTTNSTNFPTTVANAKANPPTQQAFQTTPQNSGADHVFVSEFDPAGSALLYSTYLSGNGIDKASGLAVDSIGNAYVTGTTTSTNTPPSSSFPATTGSIQTSSKAANQFFLTKVSPLLSGTSSVPYSTYIGGSTPSSGSTVGGGVAVDSSSNAYITGGTDFTDMPVLNAFQATNNGGLDAFVTKINPAPVTGSQLQYSTYLGGAGDDIGYGIAVDSTNSYITGSTTSSTNFPAAGTGVFQSTYAGGTSDAFLIKLTNPVTTGTTPGSVTMAYSTFIGGTGTDVGLAVAVDNVQGARITGWTNSPDITELNANVQSGFAGVTDAFVARIDTTATTSTAPGHYFTYLGGTGNDYGTGIAVDPLSASYVAGETNSGSFNASPVNPPFQNGLNGSSDAFLSKLGPLLSLSLSVPTISPNIVGVGNQVTFEYTITNTGDTANAVSFTDTLPTSGASFVSATVSSGSCSSASGGVVGCFIGSLNAGATATATIILTPTANTIPSTTPVILGNSAQVVVAGATVASNFGSVTVNDFSLGVSPNTATVQAGVPATYTATITPTGSIPESVSLTCSSGLPTGATCTEVPPGPFPNLSNASPVSTTLVINTTARVTTTTELWKHYGPLSATWLPIGGLTLFGLGIGKGSRRRRWLMGLILTAFFSLIAFQFGCSSKAPISTTTGTPAGTYVVTVSAASGSATRNATVTLVVQ